MQQNTERIVNFAAKLPNGIAPNSRMELRQTPRLIDEWQTIPILWDSVRSEVDDKSLMGQFILTGSAVPVDSDEIEHTGTGRIGRAIRVIL